MARSFGPYELARKLGVGGMAETWIGVRHGPAGFRQRVCIKKILPAFEDDEQFVRLFLAEARLAAGLRHANVVQVLDFGIEDGSHYMALELVQGMDLRACLRALGARGEKLPANLVTLLAIDLATALEFAHSAAPDGERSPVVHRDVSPSNVLLSYAGEVKLTDFGIAKAISSSTVTSTRAVRGKAPYIAPEYATRGEVTERSDLFALGVVLYECLAGARPFDGRSDMETMARAAAGTHTPIGELRSDVPEPLTTVIERLIAAEPADRPESAAALVESLAGIAPPPTARRTLGELVRILQPAMVPTPAEAFPSPFVKSTPPAATDAGGTELVDGARGSAAASAELPPEVGASEEATRTREEAAQTSSPSSDRPTVDDHGAPPTTAIGVEATRPRPRRTVLGLVAASAIAVFALGVGALTTRTTEEAEGARAMRRLGETRSSSSPTAAPPRDEIREPTDPAREAAPHEVPVKPDSLATAGPNPGSNLAAVVNELAARRSPAGPPAPTRPTGDTARPADSRGTVFFIVRPFGTVFVDGVRIGSSPVTRRVRPGRHEVAWGDGAPTHRRMFTVEPGARLRIELP